MYRVVVSDEQTGWNWQEESAYPTRDQAIDHAHHLLSTRFSRTRNANAACRIMVRNEVVWQPVAR